MSEKIARMTDRQRVEALLRREKPDRVPIWPFAAAGFCCLYTKTLIANAYNNPETALVAQRKTARDFGWVYPPRMSYAAYGGWEFGGEIKWPSGEFAQAPTLTKYPVETPEDVQNLKVPDVKTAGIVPLQTQFFNLSRQERLDNEPFTVMPFVTGSFTVAGNICGLEKLARWLLKKPETAHRLLRLATDFLCELAVYWKDLYSTEGALAFGGEPTSANQLISPKQFEQFALPYIKETNGRLLALGYKHIYVHICGEQNRNLPFWAQMSFGDPGILSFGHEVSLKTAAEFFPNHIIVGNLDPTIIQIKTPEEVYEATLKNVEEGMEYCLGGYVFSPGCELPPKAPIENVMAMTRAINDCGWY